MELKKCTKCGEAKPINNFQFRKDTGKYRGACRMCENKRKKKWADINPESIKASKKKYLSENPEKRKESLKKYFVKHFDKIQENQRVWRKENPEVYKQRKHEYYRRNVGQWVDYKQENLEKIKKYYQSYKKKRRAEDPIFKLTNNISSLIRVSYRNQGYRKNSNTYKILGISYEGFLNWLFTVSDVNAEETKVHIDHVVPISLARTEDEVLALNHYTNFQWLTTEDNMAKKNFYTLKENYERVLDYHPNWKLVEEIVKRENHKILVNC